MLKNKSINYFKRDKVSVGEFIKYLIANQLEQYAEDIISSKEVTSFIKSKIKKDSWKKNKIILKNINDLTQDYFFIDVNHRLRNIYPRDIHNIVKKIESDKKTIENIEG